MKRLCLLGPESVGKTELAHKLAAHFDATLMPEYGRYYDIFHKQGAGKTKGEDWTENDLIALAETHIAMRDALAEEAGPLMIEDTDIIQTAIWAEFLLGEKSRRLEDMLTRADLADHYLALAPDVEWIDDGVRYAGDRQVRHWFFDEAVKRLKDLGVSYNIVSGGEWSVRTEAAIAFAEKAFAGDAARASP